MKCVDPLNKHILAYTKLSKKKPVKSFNVSVNESLTIGNTRVFLLLMLRKSTIFFNRMHKVMRKMFQGMFIYIVSEFLKFNMWTTFGN